MGSYPNLLPGQTLAVYYDDDVYWHERLVLWRCTDDVWFVLTPDNDIYPEDLSCSGDEGPAKVKVKGVDFRYWSRVGGSAYRFATPVTDDKLLRSYIKQAYREATLDPAFDRDWRPAHVIDCKGAVQDVEQVLGPLGLRRLTHKGPAERRAGGAGVIAVGAGEASDESAVRAIVPADTSHVWLITEVIDHYKPGDYAQVDPGRDLMVGSRTGLIRVPSGWAKAELVLATDAPEFLRGRGGEPGDASPSPPRPAETIEAEDSSGDARTLMVDYDHQGTRYKEWRVVVADSRDYHYEDWPCEGPATVLHLLKHMWKYGGDPKQWLELWCRQKSISDQDRVKHELRCLMDVLYLGGTYDQLNMPVLASFETVARRVQCIVDAYAAGGSGAPDWGNSKLFTGYQGPEDLVMPQLKTWAARRGKEEVELYQARHKMRELRRPGGATEEAANAAADGSLPAGGAPKPKRRAGRGKGLEPPAAGP